MPGKFATFGESKYMMVGPLLTYLNHTQSIPENDAETISSFFDLRVFEKGAYPFKGRRICNELFFVCKGVLRIATEVTDYFYRENQLCTIIQSFVGEVPTDIGIQAACDVELLAITKRKLESLYGALPYLQTTIDTIFQKHLLEKVRIRNSYIGVEAEEQYKLFINQQPGIINRVPLKDIASYLGTTPQSLSRIRKNML
jgi:hypothetical protein